MCENIDLKLNNLDAQQHISDKTNFGNEFNQKKSSRNGDLGGLSFLQSLSNTTQNSKNAKEKEKVYVHPLHKRSASMLSEKSLEMCTESLGSETGSIISDSGDELIPSSFVSKFEKSPRMPCFTTMRERLNTTVSSFPPPLTTIRGGCSGGVQVESQRQDGRLVIKAVSVGTHQSRFEAEKMGGRLRLRLLENSDDDDDDDDVHDGDDGNGYEDECMDHDDDELKNDMEAGSNGNVGDGVIMNKLSSCKEGRNSMSEGGMISWERFWVATS